MRKILKKIIGLVFLVAAIAFVVFAGFNFTKARTTSIESEKRTELKQHAEIAAKMISPDLAQMLTFTGADEGKPYFENIRQQLTSYRKNINVRGIYTMSFRDGDIFFGPETYGKDDPMASPPGTKYEHPVQQNFDIFQTGKAYVFGPYTDEYGSFITAIAPVKDIKTGNIIMSVGVDIPAVLWYMQLAGAAKIPLIIVFALVLIFITGIFLALQYSKIMKAGKRKLRLWIVLPVALVMMFIVAIFSLHEYYQGVRLLEVEAEHTRQLIENKWSKTIERQARNLYYHAKDIAKNSHIIDLWKSKDIDSLHVLTLPEFELLRQDSKITHFYFIDDNNICLLRVHAPSKRGDIIDRHTMLMAQKSRKPSWGIETGPLGTFTLRYVLPLEESENIWGYLELGMEVEHLKDELAEFFNTDLLMLLDKNKTTREKFYAGKEVFDFLGEWEDLEDFVLLGYTAKKLPKALGDLLFSKNLADTLKGRMFRITGEDKSFLCSAVHIYDVAGESSAILLSVQDITNDIDDIKAEVMFNISIALAVILGIIVLLWFFSSKAEEQLNNTFNALRDNEEKTLVTLNSIGDAVIATDTKGLITRMNPIAERLTGWSFKEANGTQLGYVFNIINSKTRKKVPDLVGQVLKESKAVALSNHTALISRDGNEYQIADSAAPIIAKEGYIIGVIIVFHDVTSQYREQEQIRQLSIAVEQSPVCILVTDIEGNIKYVNPKFIELTGYSSQEAMGQNPRILKSGEQPEEYYKELWQTITTGKEWRGEFHNKKKNGQLYWERALISPIEDKEGVITGFVGIKEDITDYKLAQEKLRDTALQYKTLVENVPGIVYRCANDEHWTMSFISDEISRLTGYPVSDFIENAVRSYTSIIYPEDRDKVNKIIQESLDMQNPYSIEYRIVRNDNDIVWVQEKGKGIYSAEGNPLWLDGVITDITMIKQAEESLLESQRRYEQLARQSRTFNWEVDKDGLYTFVDPIVKDVIGYEPDELVGKKHFYDICPEPEREKIRQEGLAIIQRKEPIFYWENQLIAKNGNSLWVSSNGLPLLNSSGEIIGFRGSDTDITERKHAQQQIELAMQMQMEFTSTVSHELRTPLTAIKEGIAIVLDGSAGDINDEQKDFLDTAKRNVDRLTRLINDVLDFQKLKAGKAKFNIESGNINKTIEDVHKQMMPEANKRGLDFILKLDKSMPDINFDHDAIMRVVVNLANNAFKFTDKGSVTIATEQKPDENLVYIKVEDTGPGIKDSDLGRLFEDFEQLEKGKDRKTGGTGLGLAISKRIVAQHRGKIWAESEVGKGTSFIFVIPIMERRGNRG